MTAQNPPQVKTRAGVVEGRQIDAVELFVEVPYGTAQRFRAPVPAPAWEGVRDATEWRDRAPQNPDTAYARAPKTFYTIQGDFYAKDMSEDCLTLNVWTPGSGNGSRRPVLVWIHGGGYTVGHAASESYDGGNFSREQDVVFVSLTHRLNVFGFLPLDHLLGSDYAGSGNAGMLDLVLALEWVRDNIASFGGDPNNVTIVGESGGGAKVSVLMTMPSARGLFHRAVCQSGLAFRANSVADGRAYADAVLDRFGGDVDRLLAAPMQELLDADAAVAGSTAPSPGPIIDGTILPVAPRTSWESGEGSSVPLMAGWTRDETTVFAAMDDPLLDVVPPAGFDTGYGLDQPSLIDGDNPRPMLDLLFGDSPATPALQAYVESRAAGEASENDSIIGLVGYVLFAWPAIQLAELREARGDATFLYRFDWVSPHLPTFGAPHSSEIGLFFQNTERLHSTRGDAGAKTVSDQMAHALAEFVRDGVPAQWSAYRPDRREVRVFGLNSRVAVDPDADVRVALVAAEPRSLL